MKQVLNRIQFSRFLSISLLLVLQLISLPSFSQEAETVSAEEPTADLGGDPVVGKQLFNQNCAACHSLDRKMTGPALKNVEARLAEDEGLGKEWIYKWVRNSAGTIASGDAYANKIYNEYNQLPMTAFPTLSDVDIDNILAYTVPQEAPTTSGGAADMDAMEKMEEKMMKEMEVEIKSSRHIFLSVLVLLFMLLVVILFMVNRTLRKIVYESEIAVEKSMMAKRMPLWKVFVQNQFLVFCTVIMFLLGSAYFAYSWMSQIGIDQGYAPVQPIHYSHRIHAGVNKIECQYCHSSARVSKHSGIPSLNVCMNCHKNINQYSGSPDGSSADDLANGYTNEFYTKEIKKLYKAVGWDEENQQYTGESQPVEWVRIHNLPDFAYFNHSQHVSVGKIECQTCHGPVEEMEIMYQYSPLTMGWCINCHRETEVQVADNAYYEKIHTELSKKYGVEKLTAAQMGGLECGKCHY